MGRPSDYSQETANTICTRIVEGESLRQICSDPDMPARSAVFMWLKAHPSFADQYACARELSAEADADDVAYYARLAGDAKLDPSAARAAIDGLKWSAGKRQPKKYGDRLALDADVNAKVQQLISDKPLSEDDWSSQHTPK